MAAQDNEIRFQNFEDGLEFMLGYVVCGAGLALTLNSRIAGRWEMVSWALDRLFNDIVSDGSLMIAGAGIVSIIAVFVAFLLFSMAYYAVTTSVVRVVKPASGNQLLAIRFACGMLVSCLFWLAVFSEPAARLIIDLAPPVLPG
ncbi:hypothetical protein [Haloarchaeobius sp. DFWS5]|uniref:hypothetical protein n=1 Tax=Haloarchaeobius sp. DFWS5 TaxID=3446114 RepID=UPI003EB696D5